MLLKRTFSRGSNNTMLPNAFVGKADSVVFLHFVLGLVRFFLWLSVFVSNRLLSPKRLLEAIHLLHRNPSRTLPQQEITFCCNYHGIEIFLIWNQKSYILSCIDFSILRECMIPGFQIRWSEIDKFIWNLYSIPPIGWNWYIQTSWKVKPLSTEITGSP